MRLGLGTAQFGLDYGISNSRGKVSLQEGQQILELARKAGMNFIDTAPSYGESEAALGALLSRSEGFHIVTKTRPLSTKTVTLEDAKEVEKELHTSLARLRMETVYGLLVHHADDLLGTGGDFLVDMMQNLRRRNLVEKIGVSVYSAGQIDRVLKLFTPDIVQLPLNVFDQRLVQSGHLRMLKSRGIEIHARSIFLQGLLLMDPHALHPYFQGVQSHVTRYRNYLTAEGLTPLETAVQFVLQHPEIDVALVGVSAASELREIIAACKKDSFLVEDWRTFAVQDERVLDPSLEDFALNLAILQARYSSSRLPGKVMMPLGGRPMLQREIERVALAKNIDHLVVATSEHPSDDPIAALCQNSGIDCYRGSLNDVLDRFYQAALSRPGDYVVRLTGDCPLIDFQIIDEVIALCLAGGYDYASNCLVPTFPDGLDVEVVRRSALTAAWNEARLPSEREHVTPFVRQHVTRFTRAELRSPVDYSALRWTVDEPSDYQFVTRVFDALYPNNPRFAMKDILKFLKENPELEGLNRHIARNEGYQASLKRDAAAGGASHV